MNANKISRSLVVAFGFASLGFLPVGCDSSDDEVKMGSEPMSPVAQEQPMKTSVRVLHLSPDAPAVDVWVNRSIPAVQALGFTQGTSYLSIDAGTYDFGLAPQGKGAAGSVLEVNGVALAADQAVTIFAYDQVSRLKVKALVDDLSPLSPNSIRIRAIHAAPAVGKVDIWVLSDDGSASPLFTEVGFSDASSAIVVPATAYTLGFDVNKDGVPELRFAVPALPSGTVANVFAVNDSSGAVFLLAQLGDGTVVRIDPIS